VSATSTSVWDDVVGQAPVIQRLVRAVEQPVHAYLFVGPPGSTKVQAARAFAALLVGGVDDPTSRDARLILAGEHPDVHEVERVGAAISAEQAREIVRISSLAPVEGDRKVLVLHEFHLLRPEGAALLLKSIEEPPPSTTFVILADFVPHDLVTISSRCARIEFRAIADVEVADRLVLDGVDPDSAAEAADAAMGDLDRARVLAGDPELVARRRLFADAPRRLDGTGATVMALVDELTSSIERAAAPLASRHAAEIAAVDDRIARYGERGSGKKALDDRHKRELRRHRTDELRAGLAALASTYRDEVVRGDAPRPDAAAAAVHRIHEAIEALDRNPNEPLLLQSLLWSLPAISSG
jgi:DNA polymerase-3 subunit delta'